MIDIHCHLLPNIDDGPKSWEESLEMVSIASEDGIKGAVTTPHWIQGSDWEPAVSRVREKVRGLNNRIKEHGLDFTVYPGMEIGISPNLAEFLKSKCILTLADSSYLLLEIPFYSLPIGLENIIKSLRSSGIATIMAHPERCREFQQEPARIVYYKNLGAKVQITASSLCGDFGDKALKCSFEFARLGVIDFVATDAHSPRRRKPFISPGLNILKEKIGNDALNRIIENSNNIIKPETNN